MESGRGIVTHGPLVGPVRHHTFEIAGQRHGLIVFSISSAIEKGCGALPSESQKVRELSVAVEFGPVPCGELVPFGGIMAEPLSQSGAWSQLRNPGCEFQRFTSQPARPHPVDENPSAIISLNRFVDSFDLGRRHSIRVLGRQRSSLAVIGATTYGGLCDFR